MTNLRATKDRDVRGNPTWRIDSDEVALIAVLTYANSKERDAKEGTAQLFANAPALLKRAADKLQEYCAEANGDLNDSLATEIYKAIR